MKKPDALTSEVATLEEYARHYLGKLKGSEPMRMERHVFLSYARKDYEEVFKFHLALLRSGMLTWLDQSDLMGIRLNENWVERTFENLSTCCSMAYFLSFHSIQSIVVSYEVGFFLERMKIRSGVFFAIVLLHEMDVEHFKQAGIPIIEFYRMSPHDAADKFIREMAAFYQEGQYVKETTEAQASDKPAGGKSDND